MRVFSFKQFYIGTVYMAIARLEVNHETFMPNSLIALQDNEKMDVLLKLLFSFVVLRSACDFIA